jgi:hypothetical protein
VAARKVRGLRPAFEEAALVPPVALREGRGGSVEEHGGRRERGIRIGGEIETYAEATPPVALDKTPPAPLVATPPAEVMVEAIPPAPLVTVDAIPVPTDAAPEVAVLNAPAAPEVTVLRTPSAPEVTYVKTEAAPEVASLWWRRRRRS